MIAFASPRSVLLAGVFIGALTFAANAQQPATPPAAAAPAPSRRRLPPGSPLIGRPDGEAAAKLAPVASPPIATAPDKLPLAKLKVPAGFNIEVYAGGMANARSLAVGDKGTVFVGSRLVDKVYAIVNKDGKRTVKVLASGLYRPNGVAFKDGTLYIAELSKISKIEKVEDNLDNPPKPTMIYDNLPKDEAHGWKFIAIGPDNKLYIPVGQPGNNVLHDDAHGQIRRINLDGTGAEVVALGVRNTVGFDWNPENKQMYFTDNGRDWLSEDVPQDKLNRLTKVGEDFGVPYCYQGNIPDPEFGWGHSCSEFTAAGRPDGPARGRARHAVLYRQHVPEELQERHHRGPARFLEPVQEVRRRRRRRQSEQGRHGEVHRAAHHRLSGRQQICRPPGRRDADEGRFDSGLRRLERRRLPHQLRQAEGRCAVRLCNQRTTSSFRGDA